MFYSSNPPPTKTCRVCMSKYQSIINDIALDTTPLLYRPSVRKKRCTDRHAVLLVGILTFLVFLGITIGFHLLLIEKREMKPSYFVSLASRHNWNATHVDKTKNLTAPADKLVLCFTNSPNCYDQQNCSDSIHRLQEESLKKNRGDIPYNFIIADDNRIYEGRGWQYAPDVLPRFDNATFAIAFLGYPGQTKLTSVQKDQLLILVNLSISHHKLQSHFRVMTRPKDKPHLQDLIDTVQSTFSENSLR